MSRRKKRERVFITPISNSSPPSPPSSPMDGDMIVMFLLTKKKFN